MFNLERVVEVVESTPIAKTFLKEELIEAQNGTRMQKVWSFMLDVSLKDIANEQELYKYKLANQYLLKLTCGLVRNHPRS
mmetsp:Transcript_21654/g.15911  ORF Transcript_21654/g.15911 Transcript_21654/m.15911 type:complete len:80 (+) Transcript_21654:3217-3456(+)